MFQKTYSIYSDDLNDVQLFIEAGKSYIACWCRKKDEAVLRAFEFFQYDNFDAENIKELVEGATLHSRLLTMPVIKTYFFWNTDEVLCLPKENNDADFLKQNFDLLLGNMAETQIISAPAGDCVVAWRMHNSMAEMVEQNFRGAVFTHAYIPLLALAEKANALSLFFYPHYFTLIVYKENKLQFIQTRKYTTPEDVLYFILNVYKQYEIQKSADIFCCGYIDEKSKLYETLHHYLEGLQLIKTGESAFAAEEFKEYASHYFLPYINYAV